MLIFMCLAVLVGGAIPVQTAANSALRAQLHSPFLATLVNSSIGAVILAVTLMIAGSALNINWSGALNAPWWSFGGAPLAVIILMLAMLTMPLLGGVGTALAMILGSVGTGMLIDALGLFNAPQHVFSAQRAGGLCLTALGLFLMLRLYRFLGHSRPQFSLKALPGVALGLTAGASQIAQTAVNSELSLHFGSTIPTGFMCMSLTVVIILCLTALRRESLHPLSTIKVGRSFWILSGGLCGAAFLIVNAYLLPRVGAGTLVILNIAGQMAMALVIDSFGLFRAQKRSISVMEIAGLVIIFAGIALIKQPV
ncbi:MAG: DMT family transporter [Proteobacteria bacterium]|uniref:DMT family transporter n=1 Tax=Candidatus Avisuccinivibrio stercorigallinarum TaxID=2840704 RepID=A0A9D9DCH4_9GAMM|nr:DMT family transporter [Candidatus Avisuccinivibrio stercorigallinarum]